MNSGGQNLTNRHDQSVEKSVHGGLIPMRGVERRLSSESSGNNGEDRRKQQERGKASAKAGASNCRKHAEHVYPQKKAADDLNRSEVVERDWRISHGSISRKKPQQRTVN